MNQNQMKVICVSLILIVSASVYGQKGKSPGRAPNPPNLARLAQLVEANVIAVHAYQVLLARKSGKGDPITRRLSNSVRDLRRPALRLICSTRSMILPASTRERLSEQ